MCRLVDVIIRLVVQRKAHSSSVEMRGEKFIVVVSIDRKFVDGFFFVRVIFTVGIEMDG